MQALIAEYDARQYWAHGGFRSSQKRADALERIARSALAGEMQQAGAADHLQVVVHVDDTVLRGEPGGCCHLEEAGALPQPVALGLCCDASTVTVRHGEEGGVIDIGRRRRTVSPGLGPAAQRVESTTRLRAPTRRTDVSRKGLWASVQPRVRR